MTIPKLLLFAGLVFSLGACSDYLNRHDTVTLAAGDANDRNRVIHTVDPWPAHARNLKIEADGQRTAIAVRTYSTRPPAAPSGGGGTGAGSSR